MIARSSYYRIMKPHNAGGSMITQISYNRSIHTYIMKINKLNIRNGLNITFCEYKSQNQIKLFFLDYQILNLNLVPILFFNYR